MPSAPHRTLASWLASRSDDELLALLRARPDLATPVPRDFTQLASRAGSRPSVLTAIDQLDRLSLNVLAAFAVPAPPVGLKDLCSLLGDDPHIAAAVQRVREMALVFGDDDGMRLTNSVANLVVRPAGLGDPYLALLRPVPAQRLSEMAASLGLPAAGSTAEVAERIARALADGRRIDSLLADPPPGVPEVLATIDQAGGTGTIDDALRPVTPDDADTPVRWLLAHRLLIARDEMHVELPREVALAARGGRIFPSLETQPPALELANPGVAQVEGAAAGQAHMFVHLAERLLVAWGTEPPSVLRSGGVGVREMRRAARLLDVEESVAALVVETAHEAGLIAKTGYLDGEWLPTETFDRWRSEPTAKRWATLASAWLDMKRLVALSTPDAVEAEMRDKAANVLSSDGHCHWAARERREVLSAISRGLAPGAVTTVESVLRHLVWCRPSREMPSLTLAARTTFSEAEHLGLLGHGGVPSWTRALLGLAEGDPEDLVEPHLPRALDYVLLQADLTAIAPGPLEATLAAELMLAADVESTGGATVYRFTETSLRRALDAGRSAADLHALLEGHSRTPVPQPLSYLVDDVARRHGRLRIGAASAYLRCDDPAVVAELLADRRAAGLRLHVLAPGVVVSQAPPDLLLTRLREMGYAPALESPEGAVLVLRPEERRAPKPPQHAMPSWADPRTTGTTPELLNAAIRAMRAGEQAALHAAQLSAAEPDPDRPPLLMESAADTLSALREAAADRRSMWIGYVNAHGQESHRIIQPLEINGGYVAAYDHRTDEVRTFAIHRITGLAEVPRS